MRSLEKRLRNQLERTIKDARDVAEAAARSALGQLGVAQPVADKHLGDEERALRNRLRVHGRQLGDLRNPKGEQEISRLIEEIAYEHWHRMLFARFLAENDLLMYPDPVDPVAVTLEECDDLASDEGAANGWELAARYAARMLPQIFRLDSPVFQLTLPPEYQQKLEHLVADLPLEVFTASDSLGWVYQFWQSKKKDEVNASEVKIGARELPAVTQLFTEPYMVSFLLDNSLGAWWVKQSAVGSGELAEKAREILTSAESEQQLRDFFSIDGVSLSYLRFVKTEECTLQTDNSSVFDGPHWMPAAGWFEGWTENLAELKTLDPCCGSGHFLVAAFLMLVPMRMQLEGLSAEDAVDRVLTENIHGLELDQRCVELAAFALALTAWKYPGAGGYRILPELNVACSGLAISAKKEEWLALAGDNTNLHLVLEELYKQFKDAPVLGSLINPEASLGKGSLFELKWEEVGPLLTKALVGESDDEKCEIGVVAKGIAKAATILSHQYQWIVTNVPYKKAAELELKLQDYLDNRFSAGSGALETAFLERCIDYCATNGVTSIVLPQNWMFLTTYKKFREKILSIVRFSSVARLGSGAFDTITGEVVKAILFTAQKSFLDLNNGKDHFFAVDVSNEKTTENKSNGLVRHITNFISQSKTKNNPDSRIVLDDVTEGELFSVYAGSYVGLQNGDTDQFVSHFWQITYPSTAWSLFQLTNSETRHFGGMAGILYWEDGKGSLVNSPHARIQGVEAWKKHGVSIRLTKPCPASLYAGDLYDQSSAAIIPSKASDLVALWLYCSSNEFKVELEKIDQKRNVTNATFVKVTIQIDKWRELASQKYPNGLPKPYSNDPSQWIFHGHPSGSVLWDEDAKWTVHAPLRSDDTVLQVARLLGYRWPAEFDANMELADEQRVWVSRCETLLPHADEDGIVCIPSVRGEATAADRLLNLLAAAYGDAWSNDIQAQLLKNASHAGKTLETWLRDKFFTQHCKLFKNRPFIWHIWDGQRDGFAALVNYHRFDAKLLETLIYLYLGDWISRQKQDIDNGVDGAEEKLAAAENLKKKLELILEGESPHDIFVRWKPIEKQPIGWNPDLNDGVRMNIRPFMTVGDIKKKGAGILRDKPNIKWGKDRGKDVASAPWYHLGPEYGGKEGDRINDHHLSLADKKSARKVEQ